MNDDFDRLTKALRANPLRPAPGDWQRAVKAAMAAFDRHHQGIRDGSRQTGHVPEQGTSWLRRISMPRLKFAFAGMAACLLVAGVVGYRTFWTPGPGTAEQQIAAVGEDGRAARERLYREEWERLKREEHDKSFGQAMRHLLLHPRSDSPARLKRVAPQSPPAVLTHRGGDRFTPFDENPVKRAAEDPVSTFSIDVDTASYGFMRASLNRGVLPPRNAVRTEELINYFPYGYPAPANPDTPFAVHAALLPTPWNDDTRLMHVGIKGYDLERTSRPRANLVFLIDSSGSMDEPDKLPLLKTSFKLLLGALEPDDRIAIVTYAGAAGTVLTPTRAVERAKIAAALERLHAGGSTAGAEGIRQAYLLAEQHFVEDGINRVILATDGDFNVGITDPEELEGFVARKRESGVYLSIVGFGMGNYNDELMQRLAQSGNGNAAYIDSLSEARKVLVEEAGSTLFPIAKDVKIQVEFNPVLVAEYRLIGYETRMLAREDFRNDRVDAGEIGASHTVTALYEVALAGSGGELNPTLRYRTREAQPDGGPENEFATISIRYKKPDAEKSTKIARHVTRADVHEEAGAAPQDIRFAAAVAAFGQLLRGGRYTGDYGYDDVIAAALAGRGEDPFGYRAEFIGLVRLAKTAAAMESQGHRQPPSTSER